MSDYTKITDFAAKDALASGNPSKVVKGTEIDTEFNALAVAIATKLDSSGDTDLAVADGGTGASTASGALSNLGGLPLAGGTMTGDITMSGASIIEAEGAAVASASSCNIWATDGNTVHITGTTTITSFATAPQAGAWMKVIFDGALTLTHSASLNLNGGGADITTAAGDMAFVYADTTTQMDVFVIRYSGASVVSSSLNITGLTQETAPATGDEVPVYDVSAAANRKMVLSDILKVINSLTEDTSPDTANDFVLTYDTSASAVKKAKPSNLFSGVAVDVGVGGVGAILEMYNTSGSPVASGATIAGSNLNYTPGNVTAATGTWRNITGDSCASATYSYFQRIS